MLRNKNCLANQRTQSDDRTEMKASPMTVARLEEQIRMLTIKLEDIYARLDNVTSILQGTNNPLNV